MKAKITLTLLLAPGLSLIILWLLNSPGSAALADINILYVAPDGACGGAVPCYASVQAAVDAAGAGDEIRVAGGAYTDVHARPAPAGYPGDLATIQQVVYLSKMVMIRGGYTTADWAVADPVANPTTLDAGGQGRVLVIAGANAPTIEGLRLTGGNAAGLRGNVYGDDGGGGLYVLNATAVISGNQVYGNTADRGGGVQLQGSAATLRGNEVRDNTGNWSAAGLALYRSPATLQENRIVSNTALFAGGLMLHESDAVLRGNAILYNTATSSEGGGMVLTSSQAVVDSNVIRGNRTIECGGGVFLSVSDAILTNNVIAGNEAKRMGSGICVQGGAPRLTHTTLARNNGNGGGLYVDKTYSDGASQVQLTNTIIFSHTVGVVVAAGSSVTLDATLWQDNAVNQAGEGRIDHAFDYIGPPAFAPDGYHLTARSAAIDRGVVTGAALDIDGDVRSFGKGHDLGADEFMGAPLPPYPIFLPLVRSG